MVRITASEVVGAEVLPPILAGSPTAIRRSSSSCDLSNETEDLLRREADIAVRMVRPTQGALLAKRVGGTALGLFAHRRYLGDARRAGDPQDPRPARDRLRPRLAPCERCGRQLDLTREMFALRSTTTSPSWRRCGPASASAAARSASPARPRPGPRAAEDAFAVPLEIWLVMHEDLRASARLRAVYDHLADGLTAYLATSR